jgi:uncharacterized protein (DUF4213/DUF364 family)
MTSDTFISRLLSTLPDGELLTVQVGVYWTAVVAEVEGEIRCGLAGTLGDDSHHYTNEPSIPDSGHLHERSARELAALVNARVSTQISLGLAAINALLPRLPDRWTDIHAEEVIARYGAGKKVALIGHFPFVNRLRTRVGTLWVLEQEPREGDLPASMAPEIVPQADILAITAATLINHTFDGLMALRRSDALALLIGATTPLTPLLFEYGLGIISGSVVEDIESVVRGVAQGANFHQLHRMGVRLVSMTADGLTL